MSVAAHPLGTHVDPDVFISYRRSDKEFVERFVSALEEQGPEVWWDADIGGGADWRDSIVENLVDSDCLVIVFSESCNASKQLVKELAVADHLDKVVIPIKIDNSEPKGSFLYELAWRNWINVHPDPMSKLDAAAASIVATLKEAGWTPAVAGATREPLQAPPPPTPDSAAAGGLARPSVSSTATTAGLPPPAATLASVPRSALPPPAATAPPARAAADTRTAQLVSNLGRFRLRDAFPFHWADFVLPVLVGVAGLFGREDGDGYEVAVGNALGGFAMALALVGLIVFPIRYYRRRANPFVVARNLVISNVTFAIIAAIGSALAPVVDEGETANEARAYTSIGLLMFALGFAAISFVIFFVLSKKRAKRELEAHMSIV